MQYIRYQQVRAALVPTITMESNAAQVLISIQMEPWEHLSLIAFMALVPIDSANYIVKDSLVTISILAQGRGPSSSFNPVNPVATRTYRISNLTANTVTLTFQIIYTYLSPSVGSVIEIINLKK